MHEAFDSPPPFYIDVALNLSTLADVQAERIKLRQWQRHLPHEDVGGVYIPIKVPSTRYHGLMATNMRGVVVRLHPLLLIFTNFNSINMNYTLVLWPESQTYMDEPWFDDLAILADYDSVGESQAYFIPTEHVKQ